MSSKLVLSALLVPFLGGVGWFLVARFEATSESQNSSMDRAVELRQAEDDVLFDVYQKLIDRVRFDPRRANLTEDRAVQLMLAIQFFEGMAERYAANHGSSQRMRLVMAYQQLSLAHLLLRDHLAAESAIRESQRICQTQLESQEDPGVRAIFALNAETLGWTLVMRGLFDEAASLTRSAASHWEELAEKRPEETSFFTNLAVCQRNLAIIAEYRGNNGIEEARAAVRTAAVFLQREEPSPFRFDLLIDCEEVLSGFLWKRGHIAEAERICRAKIEHIHLVLNEIDSLRESTETIPSEDPYKDALVLSERNLALIQRVSQRNRVDANEPLISMSSQDTWNWNVIHPVIGQSLGEEFLVRGNRMPGEFEPQDALLVNWHEPWAHGPLLQIISAVHPKLPVILIVRDRRQQHAAEQLLIKSDIPLNRVEFLQQSVDTLWIRDYGPLSVRSKAGSTVWVDPSYSMEFVGGRPRYEDDEMPLSIANVLQIPTITSRIAIEGGAILSNGAGICLVSTKLIGLNQVMGIGPAQLTDALRDLVGAEQVIYLDPLVEEPNRHLDWFCTFTSPGTIVIGEYTADDPVNRDLLNLHAQRLSQLETPGGRLNVVRIPMPPRSQDYFGGSYTNVVFANGVLVVPTWAESYADVETRVVEIYQQLLPGWEVVTVPADRLRMRAGGPHCCTINLLLGRATFTGGGGNDPGS